MTGFAIKHTCMVKYICSILRLTKKEAHKGMGSRDPEMDDNWSFIAVDDVVRIISSM